MCGNLSVQRLLSGQMGSRRFLLRPPEPPPSSLIRPPQQSVYIGRTKFLRVPFYWESAVLVNPHICVCGITGSGKSYFVKTFITRARIALAASALILDWAGEYSEWVEAAGGRVVSFGRDGLNLLDTGGATVHQRTGQVVESLEILTDLSLFPRQRRLTEEAIEKAYARCGFKPQDVPRKGRKLPTLRGVHSLLAKGAARDPEAAEAARRLKNLLLSSGNSFCSSTMGLGSLLSGLVCVDLHSLPTESLRSMAGLAILQFVKERMRSEQCGPGRVRLFVVCDEAWKIASDARSDVVSIVREGRKYGFSLIVASQNPTDVHRSIFSNAGTVLCFRLTLASERDYVRTSLSYSDFFERQSHSLAVGQALAHLEFASPQPCPGTFILSRIDGEEPLRALSIRGGGMDLEFEKGELASKLVSAGLSDRQAAAAISEFERSSYSLAASQFVSLLAKFGYGRPFSISLLRELGAGEKELLSLFSSVEKARGSAGQNAILVLEGSASGKKHSSRRAKAQGSGRHKGQRR